jgi:hypothetical protein
VEWIRSIVRQCAEAKVPCFVKQLGANCVVTNEQPSDQHWEGVVFDPRGRTDGLARVVLRDKKGGDWDEWPEDLRVRELPSAIER